MLRLEIDMQPSSGKRQTKKLDTNALELASFVFGSDHMVFYASPSLCCICVFTAENSTMRDKVPMMSMRQKKDKLGELWHCTVRFFVSS